LLASVPGWGLEGDWYDRPTEAPEPGFDLQHIDYTLEPARIGALTFIDEVKSSTLV